MPPLAVATTTNTTSAATSLRLFVSAWPVHRRQRHILLPQVDAQLAAVVDEMVHHEGSPHGGLGHREDGVVALLQRPGCQQLAVGLAEERPAGARHPVLEQLENRGAAAQFR